MIELIYDIPIMPHQSVRQGKSWNGKKIFFQPAETKHFRRLIRTLTVPQLPTGFRVFPKEVPLIMTFEYWFKYKKDEKKCNIGKLIPKVTKPDITDNTQKLIVDSLAGMVYAQDQQIQDAHPQKWWAPKDRIKITVKEFEGEYPDAGK